MGISVEGQKCPVCNGYVFDNDDLVFCPKCGAPHHRECYAAVGNCGLADKHDTAEQYNRSDFAKIEYKTNKGKDEQQRVDEQSVNEPPLNHADTTSENQNEIKCPNCGEYIPNGGPFCPFCGVQVARSIHTPFGVATIPDPLGGLSPDEKIDDIPVTEVGAFVSVSTTRYLPRFKQMSDKKKKSWNWGAFLFPEAWFFYRKMYLPGFCFFAITLILSVMISLPVYQLLPAIAEEDRATSEDLMRYVALNWEALNLTSCFLAAGAFIGKIVMRIVAGLLGDKIYRETVLDKIRDIKVQLEESDEEIPLQLALRNKGGVNVIMGMLGIMALQWGSTLLLSLI